MRTLWTVLLVLGWSTLTFGNADLAFARSKSSGSSSHSHATHTSSGKSSGKSKSASGFMRVKCKTAS